MKWNMDMKCFFKSIGRKTRLFFSLLFVWGFSQSNIQAQTTEVLVDIDFLSDEWSSGDLPTQGSVNNVYFDADFAIVAGTEGGLNNTSNMEGDKRFAAVQFSIPEGNTVDYVTLEVKMSKATGKMRARLMKADEIGTPNSYIILHAESNLISKQLNQYGADTQINNNGTAIKPGSYVFYFGRGEGGCYIQSLKISYTYSNAACTPVSVNGGITSLNLKKGTSTTLSATTSDGTSVTGTWRVSNANPADIITVSDNTVTASSEATGSATLVFTPGDNTYCEAVIPVYVAEGYASAPTVVGENFDNSTTSWCFGEPLTVAATSASTTGTFAYQWYKDDLALAGQTQSNYSPEARGEYYCKVTYTESGYFPITVESPHATINTLTPQIDFDITGEGMYNIGGTATLQVTASGGDGSYSYQWYSADNENGDGAVAISDETSADYLVSSNSAQTFYYFCEISSGACTETTDVQTVTFTEGPCYELIFTATSGSTTWEGSYTVSGGTIDIVEGTTPEYDAEGFIFNNGIDILKVTLNKAIEVGTEIEVTFTTNGTDRGIAFFADADKDTPIAEFIEPIKGTHAKTYTIDENSLMRGITSFYVTRYTNNTTYLKSITIYCGKTCTPAGLAWSASECTVKFGAQNPSFPTLENPNNLTLIQYSSSVPEVATIGATSGVLTIKGTGTTTITATFEGNEKTYCSESVSYTLTVTCSDPVPYISPESGVIDCDGSVELKLVYKNADGTTTDVDVTNVTAIAWYQQGADGIWQEIDGATSDTYTATAAGIYKALVTDNCPQWTGNEAEVTLSQNDPPFVEKLTPFQYYQLDSTYAVTGRKIRHLFKVTPPKGTSGEPYQVSATVHRGSTISSLTYTDWITSKNNTDTIIADYDRLTEWSKGNPNAIQVGDTIVVKVTPRNMCNDIDVTYADSINIIVLDRSTHTIAYVVSGENVDDFLGVTSADIQDPLYTSKLAEMGYIPTAVNGYANYRFLNYEPFDLVLLTDYPKSDGKIGSGEENVGRAANLNDLADLVDRKPIFSLKAHMAALDKWQAKGFTGNPLTPSSTQTDMTVLCYAHEMFKDINMGTGENKTITVTTGGGSDGGKALQGFATFDVVEFVNIATIDGGTQGTLVACCERQKVVESRMMVLSINNTATQLITDDGYTAIGNILEYLLITDPIYVSDCSLVFTNGLNLDGTERNDGGGDGKWGNAKNWAPGFNMVPTLSHRVRIDKPCTVNVKAGVSAVSIRKDNDNNWEGSLTVEPGAKLAVAGRFREVRGRDFVNSYKIESEGSLTIETNETAAGAFMVYDSVAPYAQVEFYSKASGAEAQTGTDVPTEAVWQYMAIPTSGYPQAVKPFENAWMCRWDEANPNMSYPQAHWHVVKDNDKLDPFEGYALTQKNPKTYLLAGFLNVNDHTYKGLTYTQPTSGDNYTDGEKTYPKTYPGFHLLGNSFTAPIYLDSLKDEDFVNVEPTIYIYNAGTWNDWYDNDDDVGDGNSTTAGQYMALPIHAGSYTGLNVIPAMQGFFVKATSGAGNGSVAIDYRNAVVRPNYYETTTTPPPVVRAPQKERSEIPMLKVRVEGKRFADDLYLLCREDWTHDYEPGFDGKKIYGDSRTPQLFAIESDDNMSVNAVDDIDGQYLGFIAGEETEYKLTFDPSTLNGRYSRLYLHDLTAGTSIDLLASGSYSFSVGKKGETRRFLISSSSTVNEEVDGGLLKGYAYDGVLYVENFTDSEGDWTIYDAVGRKIDSGTVPGLGRYSYTLNLPYGAYTVYLRTNSIVKPVKVVF
ncbi:MAG: hypothetical protein IAA73_03160 [Bacteroidetes bacterium]|uniref:Ig-like domain-containing protein n=1 Tax=Candidatus Gallipaludibacter merdavium TaxID=2840839 RepID=A0A9D9N3V5_9BACT|nr:hypothetical protein [Candidatus Gallipaludibacter merdavium]